MASGKLTTIVAIDICGYSARSHADEAGAIASVKRLNERCEKAAADHGGRIFSRAGDAVLLEFSSVSGGIAAAEELAADPDPPIRVGVHLGEVSEMPNGDLLGHGVNVAARLQSRAPVGGVLVSEDARRAVRGPLGDRLIAKGVIKLDKIDESIGVFSLSAGALPHARADTRQRLMRLAPRAALAGLALLALIAAVLLIGPLLTGAPAARVAVFPLSGGNSDELQALATGVADDMALALTAMSVETVGRAETAAGSREERIERARELGAAIAVDGAVEQNGDGVRLTVAILRISDRTTLWSQAFDGDASTLPGLRMRAAERSADVLSCGVDVLRKRGGRMETETFSRFLRACGMQRENMRMLEMRDAMTGVVEREPNFAYARALLAMSAAIASNGASEPLRSELRQEARDQAERAIRIDRSVGHAYVALANLMPLSDWSGSERLLQQGLEHDPLNSVVHNNYGGFLYAAGRVSEGLVSVRRGVALDPLSPVKRRMLAYVSFLSGDLNESRAIVDAMYPAYPDDPRIWRARFRIVFWSGDYDAALRMVAASPAEARTLPCWREAVNALRGLAPPARAARRVRECAEMGFPDDHAVMLLSTFGDLDGAFAIVRRVFDAEGHVYEIVFAPQAAPMRADLRFMELMRDSGLLQYWRDSGHWPDFCSEPGLPYRCEAEAARLL